MQTARYLFINKYLLIEILFFIFYYFIFGILSDVEFDLVETNMPVHYHIDMSLRLANCLTAIVPVLILYKLIIQKYLFNKEYVKFAIALILYFISLNFYNLYINGLLSKLTFLPLSVTKHAAKIYNAKVLLHFGGVMYMIREYLVLFALAYFVRSLKQDEQMKTLKEQQLLSELNYLKAQLHPHFFFNTINNIYSLALKQSVDTAPMVAKLGEMMRYILYEADQKTVPLSREIQFITDYIAVEKIRHTANNSIELDVQGITDNINLEPLLLLPFIENAFKHGLEQEIIGGFVNIVIYLTDDELVLEVKNSKPMQTTNTLTGIGLQNVIKRLDILYPDRYKLETNNEAREHYTSLTLQLT